VCKLHLNFSHKVEITSDRIFSSFDKSASLIARDFFFFLDCNSISSSAEDELTSSEL
jgi:hypothetical protein